MKVLLVEDVKKLGWLGDVIEVSTGYARNYLLPQRLAVIPTEANLRSIAEQKTARAEQRIQQQEQLQQAAEAVDGAEAVIASKANEQGRLFGSITPESIAANLRQQGFKVADDVVVMPEHIKEVGTHQVTLKFGPDLTATVNVVVVAEQENVNQ